MPTMTAASQDKLLAKREIVRRAAVHSTPVTVATLGSYLPPATSTRTILRYLHELEEAGFLEPVSAQGRGNRLRYLPTAAGIEWLRTRARA